MRPIIVLLLISLFVPVSLRAAPDPILRVLHTEDTLQVSWEAGEIVSVYLVGPSRPDTALDAPCKVVGAITLANSPPYPPAPEWVVLRTAQGAEVARVAVGRMTATWNIDRTTLRIDWSAAEPMCLVAASGSVWTSLHGGYPCRENGSFAMERVGDVGYTPQLGKRLYLLRSDGSRAADIAIPPAHVLMLPLIGGI